MFYTVHMIIVCCHDEACPTSSDLGASWLDIDCCLTVLLTPVGSYSCMLNNEREI